MGGPEAERWSGAWSGNSGARCWRHGGWEGGQWKQEGRAGNADWTTWRKLPKARQLIGYAAAAAAKSLQSCPTLYDPIDGSPPGSPSLGFSRQEHWSGLPFPSSMHESEKWKWSRSVVPHPQRPPWTEAHQAPPSTGFSMQEYWSGVPLPSPCLCREVKKRGKNEKWMENFMSAWLETWWKAKSGGGGGLGGKIIVCFRSWRSNKQMQGVSGKRRVAL